MATTTTASVAERGLAVAAPLREFSLDNIRTSVSQRSQVQRPFDGPATGGPGTVYILRPGTAGTLLDIAGAVIRFDNLQATMSAGAQPRFQNLISCIIQQIIIKLGGKTVCTLSDFNLKNALMHHLRSVPAAAGDPIYGVGTAAARLTWATQARAYELPLSCLLPGVHMWPTFAFGGLELELHMAQPDRCLEAAAATTVPTYSFNASRSFLQADIITLHRGQLGELVEGIKKMHGGYVSVVFEGYKTARTQIAAGSNQVDLVAPVRTGSLKRVYVIQRPSATLGTVTTLERLHDYRVNGLAQYQGEVDSYLVPPAVVRQVPGTDSHESYRYSIINGAHGKHGGGSVHGAAVSDSTRVGYAAFDGTDPSGFSKHVNILDFTRADPEDGLISGISTNESQSDTRVHLGYVAAGSTVAVEATMFVTHDIRISAVVGENGVAIMA